MRKHRNCSYKQNKTKQEKVPVLLDKLYIDDETWYGIYIKRTYVAERGFRRHFSVVAPKRHPAVYFGINIRQKIQWRPNAFGSEYSFVQFLLKIACKDFKGLTQCMHSSDASTVGLFPPTLARWSLVTHIHLQRLFSLVKTMASSAPSHYFDQFWLSQVYTWDQISVTSASNRK